jgi:hypothetical protein
MLNHNSRYAAVSRRAFLARSAAVGALVLVPTLACSKSDSEIFADEPELAGGNAAPSGSTGTTSGTDVAATTAATPTSGTPIAAGAELAVAFSFTPGDSGRRVRNPYVAVWIEDAAGDLVQTVSLWFQNGKGQRWLPDLKRWYSAESARLAAGGPSTVDTISSATRTPGSYTVAWDGTDSSGARAVEGSYFVCIEAAREHGPYELVREPVTLGASAFSTALAGSGEIVDASVEFVV